MAVPRYIKDERDQILDVILESGIHVKPSYSPEDLERIGFDYEKDVADPENTLLQGAFIPSATGQGHGLRDSIPVLARQKRQTSVSF